jgi:RNA polymerase sigma-70 factor (ECF subfamily)
MGTQPRFLLEKRTWSATYDVDMSSHSAVPDDAELVTRTLAGDDEAFGQLFDRYVRLVRATLVGTARDEATLLDLSQEAFIRGYRKLAQLHERSKFKTWIVGIARYVATEYRRKERRDRHQFTSMALEAEDPSDMASDERINEVLARLQTIPEKERLAVQLFYLDEHSADMTADVLGMSRSGVYAVLKRACDRLGAACCGKTATSASRLEKPS